MLGMQAVAPRIKRRGQSLLKKCDSKCPKKPKPPAMAKEDKVEEKPKRKSSQAKIDANTRYKHKCVMKRVEFKPDEKYLVDYSVEKAKSRGLSFQGYVKDLIKNDMNG